MPFVPLDPQLSRTSLLVCDGCERVLARDGSLTDKTHSDSSPDELAPHYDDPRVLRDAASDAGWTSKDEGWKCARCSTAPAPAH